MMSDSTQQYILKRQPKIEMTDERIYFKLPWGEWWTSRKEHESDFVDVSVIDKQLEVILDKLSDRYGWDDVGRELRDEAFIEIKLLFGLENKETD